ncbi:short-chain dehydrogenase [Rathayibacter rathayi]|uniref:Short-chain dehydrogenase n=2 Tax=Rathayibacter rathayi TaxID=33887 RepID=A0ABD6WBV8_RATRA|nr:SDR family NAD(P)-dependent oxidoreductase [Rathayibacter rathayi]PPF15997.1 short-chain dehydrogenase [Rathayibacter rathayi]PPG70291.1 short-chain dehydrogenase [Rathayibacter rathayi]PPG78141.1 short-chain dehydrogenase [Rathayibacter rathayi]PPH24605.1 short-chain dehydrogenase [Rathayibacter rathayi]PPI04142.1 short-chain dehydrogenase [Rathayibacter rathayi]
MTGRVVVLTGASSGIGRVAAGALAAAGARVAVVGRHPERTRAVAAEVGGDPFLADFDRLDDVRALADVLLERYERIDVLANNAGGLVSHRAETVDGHERTVQSNHLAPFLLTRLLLPRMVETSRERAGVRIVSTASLANRFGRLKLDDLDNRRGPWFGGWRAYGTSKLVTILFIRELAERLLTTSVDAYSFHPGVVSTSFGADSTMMKLMTSLSVGSFGISAEAGAVPLITLASEPDVGAASGTYFDQLTPHGSLNPQAHNRALAHDLWTLSSRLVGVSPTL